MLGSLRSRIVFFFTVLLMIVQLIGFLLINKTSLEIAKSQNIVELNTGKRVFEQLLQDNRRRLIETATLLSADYGFRKAVATHDAGTVQSVLANHGQRIHADMMLLAGLDKVIIADTVGAGALLEPTDLLALIVSAEQSGEASAFIQLGERAFQIVVVPVLAPDPIAWVAMGYVVDDGLAKQLRELTNVEVSFVQQRADSQWVVLASTQASGMQQALLQLAQAITPMQIAEAEPVVVDDYATLVSVLQREGAVVYTVLQRSVNAAVLPFKQLRLTLVELGCVSLLISVLGGFLLAKKLTDPLKLLADVVDKIHKGDFSHSAELHAKQHNHHLTHSASTEEVETLRLAYIEILRLAHEDVLTGLPNRALFNERLQQMVELAKRNNLSFSVMMSDLNRFKFINDTLGHHAGDEVIKTVGHRLKAALRDSDTVARLGGDEFAMLLASGDQEQVTLLAQNLQDHILQPMVIGRHQLDVGCSIGIAVYPEHGEDAETLLRHADAAMYRAKRARNSPVLFDVDQDDANDQQLNLLHELPKAIADDELVLYFQPQICLATSTLISVDTCIHWRHPQRGSLNESAFMPFAESAGLMPLLSRWQIQAAVMHCAQLKKQDLLVKVTLNISGHDLLDPNFVECLTETLKQHAMSAASIRLAVSENALSKSPLDVMAAMKKLKGLGFAIVIRHFGQGYFSLNQIKDLPISELKIDKSIIRNWSIEPKLQALICILIAFGRQLGISVSAEGLNNEGVLNTLSALGCHFVQGELVSEFLDIDELVTWLAKSKPSVTQLKPANTEILPILFKESWP